MKSEYLEKTTDQSQATDKLLSHNVLYKVNVLHVDQKLYICPSTQDIVNIGMLISLSLIISFSQMLFNLSDVKPDQGAIPKVKPAGIYN
jgi:hypothetical protein